MVKKLLKGDKQSLARLITLVENEDPEVRSIMPKIYAHTGKAHVVGVTGPPGAGKSTLVGAIVTEARQDALKVGIVAIDPSSPFSGGALLGDRVRMVQHFGDPGVIIRSMASRGYLGGLAAATQKVVSLIDAWGVDLILVETVGVGQGEIAVAEAADTTLLVVPPGSGDEIQIMKAGVMEIGDIFVVNKADKEDAASTAAELLAALGKHKDGTGWRHPVLKTQAINGQGVREVCDALKNHREHLKSTGHLSLRREKQAEQELSRALAMEMKRLAFSQARKRGLWEEYVKQVHDRQMDPDTAARALLKKIIENGN